MRAWSSRSGGVQMIAVMVLALSSALGGCGGSGAANVGGGGSGGPPLSSTKAITAFSFPDLAATGTIDPVARTISLTVPYGVAVNSLVATFSSTGASVRVAATAQVSATTANDFTAPVTYLVTAADGSTASYTVTVTHGTPASDKVIAAFGFVAPAVSGVIDPVAGTIAVTLPAGTPVTALVATFTSTGVAATVGGVAQSSGTTANDFTSPVAYLVTAQDGTTATYTVTVTVTVTVVLSPAKAFLTFEIGRSVGVIDEAAQTISVLVPIGSDPTRLVPTFTISGAVVYVKHVAQESGVSTQSFLLPVLYVVQAADGTTATYQVTVTVATRADRAITSFSFASPPVRGVIDEALKTITVMVPYGTSRVGLVATFATTGISVSVGGVAQTSTRSANDFSGPVTYVVAADDGTTSSYTVTVTLSPGTERAITAFSFASPPTTGVIDEVAKTIAVTVPFGTAVTSLVASFTTTGYLVSILGGATQVSGVTANDFTSPQPYVVTALGGSTAAYIVTVTVAPRFHDNGDGTITDTLKNLMWIRNPAATTSDWLSAVNTAYNLAVGGHADWRLPTSQESLDLRSAAPQTHPVPTVPAAWLNTQGFQGLVEDFYWTSWVWDPNTVIVTTLGSNYSMTPTESRLKNLPAYLLPVRTGP
jgi:hypothetical protein